jgi:hypothetical protein
MNPDDLAVEIARRKKRAKDLKLREIVWKFYDGLLRGYSGYLEREPNSILPALKDTVSIQNAHYSFSLANVPYEIVCIEGTQIGGDSSYGHREERTFTTPMQFSLSVENKLVFEFNMKKTVTSGPDFPSFNEYLGEVTAFIEGPWVQNFTAFVQEVDRYKKQFWDKRNAANREKKAQSERNRFGL